MTTDNKTIQGTFNRIIKTPHDAEQASLMRWISQPENKEKYRLTTEIHEDKTSYRILTTNPQSEDGPSPNLPDAEGPQGSDGVQTSVLRYSQEQKQNQPKAMRLALLARISNTRFHRRSR